MDDLQRLRRRAGISEDFDTGGQVPSADQTQVSDPSMPMDQNRIIVSLRRAAQNGDRFADQMLEALKVAGNMSTREMWSRIADAYLKSGH